MSVLCARDAVLADLVQQSFVADLQQRRRLLAIPVGLIESFGDGFGFGPIFCVTRQRLQTAPGFRSVAGCRGSNSAPVPSVRGFNSLIASFSSPNTR